MRTKYIDFNLNSLQIEDEGYENSALLATFQKVKRDEVEQVLIDYFQNNLEFYLNEYSEYDPKSLDNISNIVQSLVKFGYYHSYSAAGYLALTVII